MSIKWICLCFTLFSLSYGCQRKVPLIPLEETLVEDDSSQSAEVESLILGISHESEDFRAYSAKELGKYSSEAVISALSKAVNDPSPFVRIHACESLGKISNPSSLQVLIACLSDPDNKVRVISLQSIALLGEPGIRGLANAIEIEGLSDSAAKYMAKIGKVSVPTLVQKLSSKKSFVRRNACSALYYLKDTSAKEALISVLYSDNSAEVRFSAAQALAATAKAEVIGLLERRLLEDSDVYARVGYLKAIGTIGRKESLPVLALFIHHSDRDLRTWTAWALGRISHHQAVGHLVEMLDDVDSSVRKEAAASLAGFQDKRAVPRLIQCLSDSSPYVREKATYALANIDGHSSLTALYRVFRNEKEDVTTRIWAAFGIYRESQDETAFEFISRYAKSWEWSDTLAAMHALSRIANHRCVDVLVSTFSSPRHDLRIEAVRFLGEMKPRTAIEPLVELLNRLELEEDSKDITGRRKLRLAIYKSLRGITGLNIGNNSLDWSKWFQSNR